MHPLYPSDVTNSDNTEIHIGPDAWVQMQRDYSKDEIKHAISEAIDTYNIGMPLRPLTPDDARTAFLALQRFDTTTLWKNGDVFSRYDYNYDMGTQYVTMARVGNPASDYFHQYNRFLCDSINAPSPYRSWYIPKFRNGVLNALFTLKVKEVTPTTLRACISLRKYIASQYKPVIAKGVYDHFDSKRILDFSAGWGDRMAGFYASADTQTYTGIDPNQNLQDGYDGQIRLYSTMTENKQAKVILGCAEDVLPTITDTFDTIFTSPPYFNIERYTQDDNQSWKKYRKFDTWMDQFLLPVLGMAWDTLEPNGHMVINIADVYSGHRVNQICDRMIDAVLELDNAVFKNSIGMQMAKRPNSNAKQDGVFVEPMWVFQKVD